MWSTRYLNRIDFRMLPILLLLMGVSLTILSSFFSNYQEEITSFWTPLVKSQIKWFTIGTGVYFFCACLDYHKIREWTWILYILMLFALIGLFFTKTVVGVHRWYRIPVLEFTAQPSEIAKLIVVISLSWFLERKRQQAHNLSTALYSGIIVGIPFLLILKQPDLGTALVLFPTTLGIFYFGGLHSKVIRLLTVSGVIGLTLITLFLSGTISHEKIRPYAIKVVRPYQYERLNPDSYHQKAAVTAIAIGGITGKGWRKGDYTAHGWLPKAHTDSVFPAFGEEFGLLGLFFLMTLFYLLLFLSFQVTTVARDHFGRLLAAGISIYLAMHILVNIGMMCGFLPITGVPLVLITYGGSCTLSTMAALGILQSIYSRRFTF